MFQILGLLVVGLIIGAIARAIKSGPQDLSILATMALGVVGAIIGGFVASLFGWGSITELNIGGFVLAVIAAFLLVGVAEALSSGRKGTGGTHRLTTR